MASRLILASSSPMSTTYSSPDTEWSGPRTARLMFMSSCESAGIGSRFIGRLSLISIRSLRICFMRLLLLPLRRLPRLRLRCQMPRLLMGKSLNYFETFNYLLLNFTFISYLNIGALKKFWKRINHFETHSLFLYHCRF